MAKAKCDLVLAGYRPEEIKEARAELRRAEANHELLLAGTRKEDLELAKARLAEATGRLHEQEVLVEELVVRAAEPSVVEVVGVRCGDLVAANQPIVRLLRSADLWVKIYVPETDLGKVRLGQAVQVTIDSHPGQRFTGKVVLIGSESEFTPRNVQSVDDRRHQVFGVRVKIDDARGIFKSGMAAEVTVPLQGGMRDEG
jgi:multidrug resistance efflux pump